MVVFSCGCGNLTHMLFTPAQLAATVGILEGIAAGIGSPYPEALDKAREDVVRMEGIGIEEGIRIAQASCP